MFEILNKILTKHGYYLYDEDANYYAAMGRENPYKDPNHYTYECEVDGGEFGKSIYENASFDLDNDGNVVSLKVDAGRYIRKYKTFKFEDYNLSHSDFNKAVEKTLNDFFDNWNQHYQNWDDFVLCV